MIYKILINIFGDNFYPNEVLSKIQTNFKVESNFKPGDTKFIKSDQIIAYGFVILMHPKKIATEKFLQTYSEEVISFLEINYKFFKDHGAQEFELYLEYYYEGPQCNFEIFNREFLLRISKLGVSLPISVYKLDTEKYVKWEEEINRDWENSYLSIK